MSKINLSKVAKDVRTTLSKHSPEILTGFGIGGMLFAVVLAVQATPKALKRIEQEKEELGVEKLTPGQTVKAAWKCYIPTAVTAATATGCLVGGSAVSLKRNAMLATAYKLSENALAEYKEKVVETIGEKKEHAIQEAVVTDKIKNTPVKSNEIIITGNGKTLCLEPTSMRYFESDIETIKKSINELNRRMRDEMYISLNELYYELGLDGTELGEMLGWNINVAYIDVSFGSELTPDGRPCLAMVYDTRPVYDFIHA